MIDNIFVIIPSLNPDEKLMATVQGMLDIGFSRIIVVNDGSDKEHLCNFPKANDNVIVIHRRQNHGKGAAMKVAFKHILRNYPEAEGVVTVDGDGQHTPKDVLNCVKALEGQEKIAVLGCREFSGEDVPKRSRMGNHITSAVFKLLCGMTLSDTQTGLRAFPTSILKTLLTVKGDRYDYETNMLLKFKQCGIRVKEVPIETVYIDENSASHFRPFVDSVRIYKFVLLYFLSSIISFLADISIFYLISKIFGSVLGGFTVLTATVIARAISSFINYNYNRTKVFDSNGKKTKSLIRYYELAIPQMLVSAILVSLISLIFKATPGVGTFIKIIVDTVLFFISYRVQQTWVFNEGESKVKKSAKKEKLTKKKIVGRTFLSIGTALAMIIVTVFSAGFMICYGPSESLRNMLVIMAKEASATKWAPGLFLPEKTIDKIIKDSEKVNTDTIDVEALAKPSDEDEWADAVQGTKLIFLNKSKFKGYVLLVKDPKRVSVGVSSENFKTATAGKDIFYIADKYDCLAAINGGEFSDIGGMGNGAAPLGLTYSKGKLVWNDGIRRTFMGFDKNDRLVCKEYYSQAQAEKAGIRDAVCFQWNNVLIEQVGEEVKLYKADNDTGTAQRTAIGQRADGTVIMIVTDGRTVDSIGATRNDMIELMLSYGAVNAGMLDGGSSAMMYHKDYASYYSVDESKLDTYQKRGLVNRYKAFTNPRLIPTYFIVSEEK